MRYLTQASLHFLMREAERQKNIAAQREAMHLLHTNRHVRRGLAIEYRRLQFRGHAKKVWCQQGGEAHRHCLRGHPGDVIRGPIQRRPHGWGRSVQHGASKHARKSGSR